MGQIIAQSIIVLVSVIVGYALGLAHSSNVNNSND